jgi:hypothetical protein
MGGPAGVTETSIDGVAISVSDGVRRILLDRPVRFEGR